MIIYEQLHKKFGLSQSQKNIVMQVGKNKKILEIGSSSGYMTKFFLKNGCAVDIVEINKEAISKIPKQVTNAINDSVENPAIIKNLHANYDFIIMADVLEHLLDPKKALENLFKIASPNTKLVISMPNIACWEMRKNLFFKGDFEYQESGLLDRTHLHFFTTKTLRKFLEENNWSVNQLIGTVTRLPLDGKISKIPGIGFIYFQTLRKLLVRKFKNLSYYHFIVVATKKL